ncbi:MAG: hypothetical protein WKF96_01340 [Solirubrobacteraceae bacterium]
MAEVPKRAGPTALGVASATIYTAPADAAKWAIVRQVTITNEGAAAATVTLGIGTANTDAAGKRWLFKGTNCNPGESLDWTGFEPLAGHATTPDLLYALASAAATLTITVGLVEGP